MSVEDQIPRWHLPRAPLPFLLPVILSVEIIAFCEDFMHDATEEQYSFRSRREREGSSHKLTQIYTDVIDSSSAPPGVRDGMPHTKSTQGTQRKNQSLLTLVPFVCGLFRKSKVFSSLQLPNPIRVISVIRGQTSVAAETRCGTRHAKD